MAIAFWLLIPVVTTLFALVWARWMTRARTPAKMIDSARTYETFRTVIENHLRIREDNRRQVARER